MPIDAVPDHVAVAVPSIEEAAARWQATLGGAWAAPRFPLEAAGFATRQLRYPGGAKLELLEPIGHGGFATGFLARYGARIHHVTLKVPDLLVAVEVVRAEGYDVVDVSTDDEHWHEGFLRPSQVGGMIVQIAWAGRSDEEWAAMAGMAPQIAPDEAMVLHGPTLHHDDLDAARRVWTTLGARVTDDGGDALVVRWGDAPLDVRVERGTPPGPVGLRVRGAEAAAA
ncbi:MAG: VOC family protein, partial [Nitriliruptoraceae bacterium]|nr:VOC family protein [Nitriliruptoraceae bacterium]